MRPKRFTYTLVALDADGYLAAATGTGPWTTIAAQPGDGLAHPLTIASTANLSGITFTVTGTGAEGQALTEAITGPNNTTVTSTKYFKTVTGVSASSTVGASTMNVGWTAVGVTPVYPLNQYAVTGASVACDIGGTINYTVQQTNADIYAIDSNTASWWAVSTAMTGATADQAGNVLAACTGARVLVNSHTSGTVALTFAQGRHAT